MKFGWVIPVLAAAALLSPFSTAKAAGLYHLSITNELDHAVNMRVLSPECMLPLSAHNDRMVVEPKATWHGTIATSLMGTNARQNRPCREWTTSSSFALDFVDVGIVEFEKATGKDWTVRPSSRFIKVNAGPVIHIFLIK